MDIHVDAETRQEEASPATAVRGTGGVGREALRRRQPTLGVGWLEGGVWRAHPLALHHQQLLLQLQLLQHQLLLLLHHAHELLLLLQHVHELLLLLQHVHELLLLLLHLLLQHMEAQLTRR
jgi:hypothetical protein